MDYLKYYDLERYLFEDVSKRFQKKHALGAFDFFSIVIWKANRAKSQIARKLLSRQSRGKRDLESVCRELTASLHKAPNRKERLRLLMEEWKFALPMASAILSVCWPEEFTVYDYRVCEALELKGRGKFHYLKGLVFSERVWDGYLEFKLKVALATPKTLSLRERDRYLWGESAASQLVEDLKRGFPPDPKMPSNKALQLTAR
jgi:hypothetical protein